MRSTLRSNASPSSRRKADAAVIVDILAGLAAVRPVFHSEADFQHAFALALVSRDAAARVRLEYRPWPGERVALDVWAVVDGAPMAFELKYLTRRHTTDHDGEQFTLLNQGAHDVRRYDVWADVIRLERLAAHHPTLQAFAICLINDPGYWNPYRAANPIDADFRLTEGRTVAGSLAWGPSAGAGTTRGRDRPLPLSGRYQLRWRDYAVAGGHQLRYLLLPVTAG